MVIEQLISPTVPTLLITDTGSHALLLMEENNVSQLPVVQDDKYMALVRESDVLDWDKPESPLSMASFLTYHPAVFASGHPFEAMRVANQQNLSVLPVVDNENTYLGCITRDDLLKYITENSGVDSPGGIIVIELAPRDYSLSEIARICESEEVIITSAQVASNKLTGKIEVTLKTNRSDLQGLGASFERHNYIVKQIYGEHSQDDDLRGRYDLLMNYINM
ncbi:MAG: CBS domain-containing protein [Bacteroidetes bacterium]|nr:CBS domain-containing protein [Bacteroidota bacterium]MBS1739374.1 CBS domain-containing protein [Bacteroidota bacterium]MBS1775750.1 CBS domain-containing protein [Bacteroidota bacterium]